MNGGGGGRRPAVPGRGQTQRRLIPETCYPLWWTGRPYRSFAGSPRSTKQVELAFATCLPFSSVTSHSTWPTFFPRLTTRASARRTVCHTGRAAQSRPLVFIPRKQSLVEAAGIEPASEEAAANVTTCVVRGDFSSPYPPRTKV